MTIGHSGRVSPDIAICFDGVGMTFTADLYQLHG